MAKLIPEITDMYNVKNTDNEPHTVQEILDHVTRIREYLISGLVEMGFELVLGDHERRITYRKWINTDTKRNLWLTVEMYTCSTYINCWVNKLWDGDEMGNGFYHKSVEWWDDLFHFLYLVSLAK